MYLAATLLHGHPQLKWDQPLKDKRFVDFGQMVLLGFGRVPLNPVRIAVTLCYGIASGQYGGARLKEVYEYWSRMTDNAKTQTG